MFFNILQLLLFLLFFCCLAGLTKRRVLRAFIALIGSVGIAAELTSVLIGSSLIDYKFYTHFKLSIATTVGGFFFWQVLGMVVISLLSGLLIYWGGESLRAIKDRAWPFAIGAILLAAGLFVPGGIATNIAAISEIHFAKEKAFQEALDNTGIKEYTLKKDLVAKPGKNIIAIFMESLEIGYLQEKLAHLTPNMNKFRREETFYPMTQNGGGDYTIGALYSYMTGIPMHFKNHGNNVFEEVVNFELSSVPEVLNRAGYHQEYIAGNPKFAGMDVMWQLMGVEVKSENDFDSKYNKPPWGLHDRDLFEIVDGELDRLYAQKQPFAYYISTISTHATDGVRDEEVEKKYPPQESQLELMALALDDAIGKLIEKLSASGQLDNTAIYIMPDHLLLSNYSRVLEDFGDKRELFLLTNTSSKRFDNNEQINQVHLPSLLLEGAGVEHNMVTIGDQKKGTELEELLEKQKLALLQLNEAALTKQASKQENDIIKTALGDEIIVNKQTIQLISKGPKSNKGDKQDSYVFIGTQMLPLGKGMNVVTQIEGEYKLYHFDTRARPEQSDSLLKLLAEIKAENIESWLVTRDTLGNALASHRDKLIALGFPELAKRQREYAYLGYHHLGYISEKSSPTMLAEVFPKPVWRSTRTPRQIAADAKDSDKWIAHAGGVVDGIDYANFLEALDESYGRGYRLFELDIIETSDGKYVAAHDWQHWKSRARYSGEVPVSHEVFMNTKIVDKYTPLDMEGINKWFAQHEDAILITDKVNAPRRFAQAFIDKDRLMMELFSLTAVEEAQEVGIREVLLTEIIWQELAGDKIKSLEEKGVGALAVSIKTITEEPEYYRWLKSEGIKVYAFHISGYGLMDESFMARYGLDLSYGLYADDWSLK